MVAGGALWGKAGAENQLIWGDNKSERGRSPEASPDPELHLLRGPRGSREKPVTQVLLQGLLQNGR